MKINKKIYNLLGTGGQSLISRTKYSLGLKPRVNPDFYHQKKPGSIYPFLFRSCIIISADLELAWGWNHAKGQADPISHAKNQAQQTRENFPEIMHMFHKYEIPVTWATIGHLFLDKCRKKNGLIHPEILRLPYFTNEFWQYKSDDWFDSDPTSDHKSAPEWYAPDLIRQITDSPVKHEIACHTFSHINMSEKVCPSEVAESELEACKKAAESQNIKLRSFVFPGNIVGNIQELKNAGIKSYRLNTGYELDYPRRDKLGIWQIPGGICLEKPPLNWSNEYWLNILKKYVKTALNTGTICHFWFHPSMNPENIKNILEPLLEYIYIIRSSDQAWITTMSSLTEWLDQRTEEQTDTKKQTLLLC
ncbi:polysaccharide deacetylase family protein [Candidatus Poribacteria bacterium]|nr:polysaccharide deacetylase family protein [Candidatus Poribacteria bacterium]